MSEKRLYCVWRIDGEFNVSDMDASWKDKPFDEIIVQAIHEHAEFIGFTDEKEKQRHIEECIKTATDSDYPGFLGYEMPMVILSSDIEFIGA